MVQNPFKILNVYADCSAKEMVASKARLTAFTSVGKAVKDLVGVAKEESQDRTTAQIQVAYNALQQPITKIKHALLWFFKPEDDTLRKLLENGDMLQVVSGYEDYYSKLDDNSPKPLWLLQDLTTINVLSGNGVKALTYAYEIFPRAQEWLNGIGCETLRMSSQELETLFMTILDETGQGIEPSQLCLFQIERTLKELNGSSFEFQVLKEKVFYIEKFYSEAELDVEKAQLENWSDRLAQEAMRIINENFSFWPKMFASVFWCKASDEVKSKATYAATILEDIKKLFDCSNNIEKEIAKMSKELKLSPPSVIVIPGGLIAGGLIGVSIVAWFPVRCMLWVLFSLFGVENIIGKCETFLMKCVVNSGMVLAVILPIGLTSLILLDIIPIDTIWRPLRLIGIFAISERIQEWINK